MNRILDFVLVIRRYPNLVVLCMRSLGRRSITGTDLLSVVTSETPRIKLLCTESLCFVLALNDHRGQEYCRWANVTGIHSIQR